MSESELGQAIARRLSSLIAALGVQNTRRLIAELRGILTEIEKSIAHH